MKKSLAVIALLTVLLFSGSAFAVDTGLLSLPTGLSTWSVSIALPDGTMIYDTWFIATDNLAGTYTLVSQVLGDPTPPFIGFAGISSNVKSIADVAINAAWLGDEPRFKGVWEDVDLQNCIARDTKTTDDVADGADADDFRDKIYHDKIEGVINFEEWHKFRRNGGRIYETYIGYLTAVKN